MKVNAVGVKVNVAALWLWGVKVNMGGMMEGESQYKPPKSDEQPGETHCLASSAGTHVSRCGLHNEQSSW